MGGVYIGASSDIRHVACYSRQDNRNTYPCIQDAEQALARCMVLQLARHYNGCEQHEIEGECYKCYYNNIDCNLGVFKSGGGIKSELVRFLRKSDLEKCIKDNEELFKKMLGIK
jgi:hypothetical protein